MQINEVIARRGMRLRDVSREMGLKPSALQNAIDRNLTVKTLRQIATAAKCSIAEFFLDELTLEERLELLRSSLPDAELQPVALSLQTPVKEEQPSAQNTLPFADSAKGIQQESAMPGVFVCPHCGAGVSFSAFVVREPNKE